jgi:hypothetical protein
LTPKEKQRQALLGKREEVTGIELPVKRAQTAKLCKTDVLIASLKVILDYAYSGSDDNRRRNLVWRFLRGYLQDRNNWKKSG